MQKCAINITKGYQKKGGWKDSLKDVIKHEINPQLWQLTIKTIAVVCESRLPVVYLSERLNSPSLIYFIYISNFFLEHLKNLHTFPKLLFVLFVCFFYI